ncbi:hypothetical protein [Acidovorax sp. BL-A-41-H1]|uniref:hypothetical protein n=1 Tax=Acidovorax sp. BL-A-41-H1 TaxID=3421102 RepID=UPI003F7A163C
MGLTLASLATSLRVVRPLERRLASGLVKGKPVIVEEVDLVRIALSMRSGNTFHCDMDALQPAAGFILTHPVGVLFYKFVG